MEGVSVRFMKGLRGYWGRQRRGYERLDRSIRRPKTPVQFLGEGRSRRRPRFFRIRVAPRLRFLRALSPKKLLVRLRDAYVNMMLGFANSRALSTSYGGGIGSGVFGYGYGAGLRGPKVKEYDEKMIVEIYKLMIAQQQQQQQAQLSAAEITFSRSK